MPDWRDDCVHSHDVKRTGDCALEDATVSADIILVYPRWVTDRVVGRHARSQWRDMLRHMERHEQVHAEHAIRTAQALERVLFGLAPHDNCAHLVEAANQISEAIMTQFRELTVQFDDSTAHGVRDAVGQAIGRNFAGSIFRIGN